MSCLPITSAWACAVHRLPWTGCICLPICVLLPSSLPAYYLTPTTSHTADRIGPYYLARLITAAPLRIIQGLLFSGIM